MVANFTAWYVLISCKYSELEDMFSADIRSTVEQIHTVVDQNEEGTYTYGPFHIDIRRKENLMDSYKKEDTMRPLLAFQEFTFI